MTDVDWFEMTCDAVNSLLEQHVEEQAAMARQTTMEQLGVAAARWMCCCVNGTV